MKTLFGIMIMAALSITLLVAFISVAGCRNTSNMGGIAPVNEEFSISVPSSKKIKQGQAETIKLTLNRGAYFKQDVQLEIKAEGIQVSPENILVKSSDSSDVQIKITVDKDTALGEYTASVKGTPTNGRSASTTFMIKVVAE